jgi:hypothetical protein
MSLTLAVVVLALAGVASPAFAQGEEGAVPIEQAPYHLPVFSNEYVTVLKIEIPPQRDTGYHTHTRDSVSVNIEPADNVNQDLGSSQVVKSARAERGRVQFTAYGAQPPRSHKNTNVGTTPFHNVSFIFKASKPHGFTPSTRADASAYTSVLDNGRVRGWRLVLEPGQSVAAITQQAPGLRIVVSGGEIVESVPGQPDRSMLLRTGEFYWQNPKTTRAVRNRGTSRIELVEFELK